MLHEFLGIYGIRHVERQGPEQLAVSTYKAENMLPLFRAWRHCDDCVSLDQITRYCEIVARWIRL